MQISVELELAAKCCRWAYSGECEIEIGELSRRIDWDRFLQTIRRHRVQGLVAKAVREGRLLPPKDVADAIAGDALAISRCNLLQAKESLRLQEKFSAAGIPLLFIKGLTLSRLAYGDPFIKMSADLDMLVDAASIERSAVLLKKLCYAVSVPAVTCDLTALSRWHARHKESVWMNKESGVTLDLHTRLSDNSQLIPDIGISSQRQNVLIGVGHSLPTLATEDLLSYLCVHGASSAWFRLKWIADLAALLHGMGSGSAEFLHESSVQRRAGRAPAQALLLAQRLFSTPLSARLHHELRHDAVNRLLSRAALKSLRDLREPTMRPLGTACLHLTQPLLLSGWRSKTLEINRQFRQMLDGTNIDRWTKFKG